MSRALRATGEAGNGVYLHLDLDALDASVARVNVFAAAGGPDGDELVRVIETTVGSCEVRAASLTAYDPELDPQQRIPPIAADVLSAIGERA